MVDKWMQGAVEHPGGLHRALGVPEGEKIPEAKIEKAEHSPDTHLKRMAVLAETFAHHAPNGSGDRAHAHKQTSPGARKAHHAS